MRLVMRSFIGVIRQVASLPLPALCRRVRTFPPLEVDRPCCGGADPSEFVKAIRCLPDLLAERHVPGQASDKPQGRKPRAGIGTAVPRWNYGDLRAAGCGLGRGRGDCVKGAAA